jgi:hypothetical protein
MDGFETRHNSATPLSYDLADVMIGQVQGHSAGGHRCPLNPPSHVCRQRSMIELSNAFRKGCLSGADQIS